MHETAHLRDWVRDIGSLDLACRWPHASSIVVKDGPRLLLQCVIVQAFSYTTKSTINASHPLVRGVTHLHRRSIWHTTSSQGSSVSRYNREDDYRAYANLGVSPNTQFLSVSCDLASKRTRQPAISCFDIVKTHSSSAAL